MFDSFYDILWDFCRKMFFWVVEHGGADAVLTASAMQHVDIDATLTTLPKSLVFSEVGEGHGLVA